MLIAVGRELEIGWLPPLIQQSRNAKIQVGAKGYVDASMGAAILDIPTGNITRAMGDVHPLGNPHYWTDPENGKRIAREIADKLSELQPGDRAVFQQRLADFSGRVDAAEKRWLAQMAPYKGTKVVTYHNSFPNFAQRFGRTWGLTNIADLSSLTGVRLFNCSSHASVYGPRSCGRLRRLA